MRRHNNQITPVLAGRSDDGVLYSAVMVAALAGSVAGGALLMALFALGTSVTMAIGPWLWLHLQAWRGPAGAHTGQTAPVVFVFPVLRFTLSQAAVRRVTGPGVCVWRAPRSQAVPDGPCGWA